MTTCVGSSIYKINTRLHLLMPCQKNIQSKYTFSHIPETGITHGKNMTKMQNIIVSPISGLEVVAINF